MGVTHITYQLMLSGYLQSQSGFLELSDYPYRAIANYKGIFYLSGDEHQALKGLIKASGVFIHMEYSHQDAVERLALKSSKLLRKYAHCLTFITNLNVLI
jgi:hypothetical protein